MLFISRFVDYESYGVVDTDDGVEEVISLQDVYRASYDLGLDIQGVRKDGKMLPLNHIRTYQNPDTLTKLQVKTKVLHGVDITVYNGMITSLLIDINVMAQPARLRLSDYGESCGDRILVGNRFQNMHRVTLVLDDHIRTRSLTFWIGHNMSHPKSGTNRYGVVIDMTEMTSDDAAWNIYRVVFNNGSFSEESIFSSIIDTDERFDMMVELIKKYRDMSWYAVKEKLGSYAVC